MTDSILSLQDHDGDRATLAAGTHHLLLRSSRNGVYLDRDNATMLVDRLQDWLAGEPQSHVEVGGQRMTEAQYDAVRVAVEGTKAPTCCTGEDSSECCPTDNVVPLRAEDARTILEEAQDAVYGDRQADYGHPREDFTRTAIIWTGLLHHKLADGEYLEAEDIARCQIGVKLARDVHAPKRDNRVDMAGYALTLDRLETGR